MIISANYWTTFFLWPGPVVLCNMKFFVGFAPLPWPLVVFPKKIVTKDLLYISIVQPVEYL